MVAKNVSVLRSRPLLNDFETEVMAKPRDKKHAQSDPFGPEIVVDVGAIHHNDGAPLDRQQMGHLDVTVRGIGQVNKLRHIVVVVPKAREL